MTTRKREIPIDGTPEPEDPDFAAGGTTEVTDSTAPADERDAVTKERDQLADALLRLRAEFDNYRRRSAKELTDSRSCAQADLLADLLPVLDNLERALDAAEHHEEGKVLQGVRMTRDLFVGLLTRAGVEEVSGLGTHFDPEVHDAIVHQPSEEQEGVVTAVLERGYKQGQQVLRPARVVVSAGPCEMPATD
jgi:molecular chaperone GrpE